MIRNRAMNYLFKLGFVVVLLYSATIFLEDTRSVNITEQIHRLFWQFFPPDFSDIKLISQALIETIKIATLATFFSFIIAIPLSIGASRTTSNSQSRLVFRTIFSVIRTIPSLVWAVLAVALLGANAKAGVLALTMYSIGYLGKFFTDTLDQADKNPSLWLKLHGASAIQAFQFALWPHLRASLSSQGIWMWEYNIRSASIIGYVGAGGLGMQLHVYQEYAQWNKFCGVLIIIFVLVVLLDQMSDYIKKSNTTSRIEKNEN